MVSPVERVHGHFLRQVQAREFPDLRLAGFVDEEPPGLARVTGDGAEILAGNADLHRFLQIDGLVCTVAAR